MDIERFKKSVEGPSADERIAAVDAALSAAEEAALHVIRERIARETDPRVLAGMLHASARLAALGERGTDASRAAFERIAREARGALPPRAGAPSVDAASGTCPLPEPLPAPSSGDSSPRRGLARRAGELLALAPLRFALAHRRAAGALAAASLLCLLALDPERVTGRGRFEPLPAPLAERAGAALRAAGFSLRDGSLPVRHARRFAPLEGLRVVFAGRAAGEKRGDLRVAHLVPDGAGLRVASCEAVRPTEGADEFVVVPLEGSLACVAELAGGRATVTVTDGLHAAPRQFLFASKGRLRDAAPSPLAPGLLSLVAQGRDGEVPVLLHADSGVVHPAGVPVEFIPAEEGSEPFLPRLVERVRNLPFVGSERIARLEDLFYGAKDRVDRALHADEAESEEAAPPTGCAEREPAPSLLAGLLLSGRAANDLVARVRAECVPHLLPLLPSAEASAPHRPVSRRFLAARSALERAAAAARAHASGLSRAVGEIFDAYARSCANIPPPVETVYKNTKRNEGIWRPLGPPAPDGVQALYTAMVRVDPARPFAEVTYASVDLSRVDLRLVGGTEEPVAGTGVKGRGVIPRRDEVRRDLVCSFNGGFRTKHGKWGFIVDGVELVEPVGGIATVAVDERGGLHLGAWGEGVDPDRAYLQLRQNLPLLVENGKFNRENKQWGFAVNNETHIWRSGIGISPDGRRLIYAAGRSLTAETLARAFTLAGCRTAMELDVNEYHTYFIRYEAKETAEGGLDLDASLLREDMRADRRRNLEPYTRDFFYMTWRRPDELRLAAE